MSSTTNGNLQGSTRPLRVAIIGAGFSGAMVAIHLLRQSDSAQIEIIDERLPGRGLAYSTHCDQHLLNVPAIRMSAFGNEPHHFLNWWQSHGNAAADAGSFAPRKIYGTYIQDVLETAARSAGSNVRFLHHVSSVVELYFDGLSVHVILRNGSRLEVDRVVLALGNPTPRDSFPSQEGYYSSPWQGDALAGIAPDRRVLLIGSGLTAVDAFLMLVSQGHVGPIHMVSRRGQLPRAHETYRPLADAFSVSGKVTARRLVRLIRADVEMAESQGTNWRAVIDSLRSVTNELWQQLGASEQLRVFRHLKTWWDVHRHRMAPEIGAKIQDAVSRKQLVVHAGRVQQLMPRDSGLQVEVRLGEGSILSIDVDRVINCTGPDSDYQETRNPLIRHLLATGLVSPGRIGRGLQTNEQGELVDRNRRRLDWLFTLGPPRLGDLFETTAVPELRRQAEALANHLLSVDREPVEILPEMFLAAGI
jgi:uncharacterized NAD(P)/FAD-binding protein YdhS